MAVQNLLLLSYRDQSLSLSPTIHDPPQFTLSHPRTPTARIPQEVTWAVGRVVPHPFLSAQGHSVKLGWSQELYSIY